MSKRKTKPIHILIYKNSGKYKKYGFCDVLPKPYKIEDLSKILSRVMKK